MSAIDQKRTFAQIACDPLLWLDKADDQDVRIAFAERLYVTISGDKYEK